MEPNDPEPKPNIAGYMWVLALSVGTGVGAGIGAALGNVAAGVGIGVGAGVVVGFTLCRRYSASSSDDQAGCDFRRPFYPDCEKAEEQ
jgi:hypothetical protein